MKGSALVNAALVKIQIIIVRVCVSLNWGFTVRDHPLSPFRPDECPVHGLFDELGPSQLAKQG